jgi:6-phospho-beta-glucosidase
LVPSVEVTIQMLDEMLEANKEYLPQFFTESTANV